MTFEPNVARQWLYQTLAGDAVLCGYVGGTAAPRIYDEINASETLAFPYIVFQLQPGARDLAGVGARRIWTDTRWLVRGIDQVSDYGGTLGSIAARIDALLHDQRGTVAGAGYIVGAVREQPFTLVEIDDGVQYRHAGGIFAIQAQS